MEKQGEHMKMTRNQCIGSIRIGNRGATAYMQCRNSRDVDYNISSTAIPIRMRISRLWRMSSTIMKNKLILQRGYGAGKI